MDVVEAEQSTRSTPVSQKVVEGSQYRHARLPRVGIHRFKEFNVAFMDISFISAIEPLDLHAVYC